MGDDPLGDMLGQPQGAPQAAPEQQPADQPQEPDDRLLASLYVDRAESDVQRPMSRDIMVDAMLQKMFQQMDDRMATDPLYMDNDTHLDLMAVQGVEFGEGDDPYPSDEQTEDVFGRYAADGQDAGGPDGGGTLQPTQQGGTAVPISAGTYRPMQEGLQTSPMNTGGVEAGSTQDPRASQTALREAMRKLVRSV